MLKRKTTEKKRRSKKTASLPTSIFFRCLDCQILLLVRLISLKSQSSRLAEDAGTVIPWEIWGSPTFKSGVPVVTLDMDPGIKK